MIFYLAADADGKIQIKGTQADAKATNKDFQQIDIPVDKGGLMAWIQQMLDETLNAQGAAEPVATPVNPETLDDVEEILDELISLGGGDMFTIKEYAERIAALVPEAPMAPKPKATVTHNPHVAEILTALEVSEFIETVGEKRLTEIEDYIASRREVLARQGVADASDA